MSRRSKREVAPPPPQTSSTRSMDNPQWGSPLMPGGTLPAGPASGEAMAPPSGWWTARPLMPAAVYGAPWGAYGHDVPDASAKEVLSPDPIECPPGGYVNFLQNGNPFYPAPWPSMGRVGATSGLNAATAINIDDTTNVRTEKRLAWTVDEEKRLVSAWVRHSNDSIDGNCKKTDQYWGDVLTEYDLTTPVHRRRKVKHLKDRFQKIKKWVGFFCGSWAKANSVYASGQSDDQLRDKALQFYMDDYPSEGPFSVMHCWTILRDEPKWHRVLQNMNNSRKRMLDDEGEAGNDTTMPQHDGELERPMGTKEAKKQRKGKSKVNVVEAARLTREASLLDSYKSLMNMDTKDMDDDMKAEHKIGLKIVRDKLRSNFS